MDVVLDTNIIAQDFLMNSTKFRLLFDYLKKTDSKIIMPQIVYQELAGVYAREITARLKKFTGARKDLVRRLVKDLPPEPVIDVSDAVGTYMEFLKQSLGISDGDIVPYKDDFLRDLVARAIKRVKPFSEKGEGFRDTLLWLTVLDISREAEQETVTLISNDVKAFGHDHSLYGVLSKELLERGLTITFYNSIDKFIESHAVRIEYITQEWLVKVITDDVIESLLAGRIRDYLESLDEYGLRRRGWESFEFTGYINLQSSEIGEHNLAEFYIYEMSDGSLYVKATYYVEVEVEFSFEEKVQREEFARRRWYEHDEYEYDYIDEDRYKTETKFKYEYPEAEIFFGVSVKDGEVVDIEVVDWGL